jgi:hypothetical protein
MKRTLVGIRGGKIAINWPAVLLTGLVVGIVSGSAAAITWFMLTGEFRFSTIFFAVALFIGLLAGESIRKIRSALPEQLSPL